jgi:hypothetical protein
MCCVRRRERCFRAGTGVNTPTHAGAKRSDKAAGTTEHSRNDDAGPESNGASGNTANKSDRSAWRTCDTASNAGTDTAGR